MALSSLEQFVVKRDGQPADFDGQFGPQCADLVAFYCTEVLGVEPYYADAINWFTDYDDTTKFVRVVNDPNDQSQAPERGDIVVWLANTRLTGVSGHIDLCLEPLPDGFVGFDQNYAGAQYCRQIRHLYAQVADCIAGWLKPVIQGGEDMFNEGDRVNANVKLYGEDKGWHNNAVGQPWKDAMYLILESQEFEDEAFMNEGDVGNYFDAFVGRKATSADLKFHKGLKHKASAYNLMDHPEVKTRGKGDFEAVTEQLFRKK